MKTTLNQHDLFGGVKTIKLKHRRIARVQTKLRETVAIFVHLGAGLQSSTIVHMIIAGLLPRPTAVLFADTGDEPYWVYKQVWYLAGLLNEIGIPLIITDDKSGKSLRQQVTDPLHKFVSLPLYTINPNTGKVGHMKRQCTANRKIVPCTDVILDTLIKMGHAKTIVDKNGKKSRRVNPGVQVEDWYGISVDELERAGKRGGAWRKTVYPLIDRRMSRDDCETWLKGMGLPIPRKSACKYCPFRDDENLLDMQENEPEIFEEICVLDDWFRTPAAKAKSKSLRQEVYIHRSCKPLRSVDLKAVVAAKREAAKNRTRPLFDAEVCGDHCMT